METVHEKQANKFMSERAATELAELKQFTIKQIS